ncbi:hypothetical protein [Leucobacter sp. GX24907]
MTDPTHTSSPDRTPRRAETDVNAEATAALTDEWRESEFATHGDPTIARDHLDPRSKRPGVQWVRPTDVAARAGGAIVDRGTELNVQLRDAVLAGVRDGRALIQERLARRQRELEPVTSPTAAVQRSLGRAGVSR